MDIKTTRRLNMRRLINRDYGSKQADFASAIGRQPDYVSRCLKGSKGIGEDLARDIESKLRLTPGWLDREQGKEGESVPDRAAPPVVEEEFWKALSPRTRALVEEVIMKSSRGALRDDDIRLLQDMVDKFSKG